MTTRLIVYAVALLVIVSGSAWCGYHFTARHYHSVIERDRAAQALTVQDAQRKVIVAQAAQREAEQRGEQRYEELKASSDAATAHLLGSVRNLQAALHLGAMPPPVANPGKPQGASGGSSGDPAVGRLIAEVNQRIAEATESCGHDSARLAAILASEPQ